MRLSARALRRIAAGCFGLSVIFALAIAASWSRPFALSRGRAGVGFGRGVIGVFWASGPITGQWTPGIDYPQWTFVATSARTSMWATSIWRPSTNGATMMVGAGPLMSLDVLWVPLWNPVAACLIAGMGLRWRASGRRTPGGCAACGYSLAGLVSATCPECGSTAGAAPGG